MFAGSFMQTLYRMSVSGTVLLLLFLLIRSLILQYPRKYCNVLWALLALRFLVPVFLPLSDAFHHLLSREAVADMELTISNQSAVRALMAETSLDAPSAFFWIWLGGTLLLVGVYILSFLRMAYRVKPAVKLQNNIYITDYTGNVFVFGIIKPKIMIPSSVDDKDREFMILHEQCHIQRKDPWVKLIAWMVVSLHWFNPFIWLAFFLFTSDMEISCDEKVIQTIGRDKAAAYAEILLKWTIGDRRFSFLSAGIGGGSIKKRIRHIAYYKTSPKGIVWLAGSIAVLLTCVFFLQPKGQLATSAIERYYARAYDSWWHLQMRSFDDVLDAESIQSQNFKTAMKENIYQWQYSLDHGYFEGERELHKPRYHYKNINYSEDGKQASVVVDLLGSDDGMPAYPAFVTLGENRFVMIKENGIWKIAEHQYDDAVLFEKSLDQLIGFDKAALKKRLDQEYAEQ